MAESYASKYAREYTSIPNTFSDVIGHNSAKESLDGIVNILLKSIKVKTQMANKKAHFNPEMLTIDIKADYVIQGNEAKAEFIQRVHLRNSMYECTNIFIETMQAEIGIHYDGVEIGRTWFLFNKGKTKIGIAKIMHALSMTEICEHGRHIANCTECFDTPAPDSAAPNIYDDILALDRDSIESFENEMQYKEHIDKFTKMLKDIVSTSGKTLFENPQVGLRIIDEKLSLGSDMEKLAQLIEFDRKGMNHHLDSALLQLLMTLKFEEDRK